MHKLNSNSILVLAIWRRTKRKLYIWTLAKRDCISAPSTPLETMKKTLVRRWKTETVIFPTLFPWSSEAFSTPRYGSILVEPFFAMEWSNQIAVGSGSSRRQSHRLLSDPTGEYGMRDRMDRDHEGTNERRADLPLTRIRAGDTIIGLRSAVVAIACPCAQLPRYRRPRSRSVPRAG